MSSSDRLRGLDDASRKAAAAALLDGRIAVGSSSAEISRTIGLMPPAADGLRSALDQAVREAGSEALAAAYLAGVLSSVEPTERAIVVCTAPGAAPRTRETVSVLRERIRSAQTSILLVGYSITSGADTLIDDLGEAARRSVAVAIVADRLDEKLHVLAARWPIESPPPQLWSRPANREDPMSALHAKAAIFDNEWVLVTSANLTYHGLAGNLEIGVLLRGPIASRVRDVVRGWTSDVLVELSLPGSRAEHAPVAGDN